MRAMRLEQPAVIEKKPLQEVEIPIPEPEPGQLRLRISACGLCHTDLHIIEGEIQPPSYPIIPGHQIVGVVDAIGRGVSDWSIGDRGGLPWLYRSCEECEFCERGEQNICPQAQFTGFSVNGGFTEYVITESDFTLRIPGGMDDVSTAPLLCAGIIGYRSLKVAGVQANETIGLFGFGASAHIAIQIAQHWQCKVVVFTRSAGHRQLARDLGAIWVGGIEDQLPGHLDRAILFAPVGYLVPICLDKLRPGGTLAINAIYLSPIPEMAYEKIYGERVLRSVANATYQDGVEFLRLADQMSIRTTTQTYDLPEANQALQELKTSQINGAGVLVL